MGGTVLFFSASSAAAGAPPHAETPGLRHPRRTARVMVRRPRSVAAEVVAAAREEPGDVMLGWSRKKKRDRLVCVVTTSCVHKDCGHARSSVVASLALTSNNDLPTQQLPTCHLFFKAAVVLFCRCFPIFTSAFEKKRKKKVLWINAPPYLFFIFAARRVVRVELRSSWCP